MKVRTATRVPNDRRAERNHFRHEKSHTDVLYSVALTRFDSSRGAFKLLLRRPAPCASN